MFKLARAKQILARAASVYLCLCPCACPVGIAINALHRPFPPPKKKKEHGARQAPSPPLLKVNRLHAQCTQQIVDFVNHGWGSAQKRTRVADIKRRTRREL